MDHEFSKARWLAGVGEPQITTEGRRQDGGELAGSWLSARSPRSCIPATRRSRLDNDAAAAAAINERGAQTHKPPNELLSPGSVF